MLKSKKTLILLGVILVSWLVLCFRPFIWGDEAYTLNLIKHNFTDIWNITGADVHPPLYYFMLKAFCMVFGYSIVVSHIFSLLPNFLILLTGIYKLNKEVNERCANIFAVLLGFSPFAMKYTSEIRMYSLAALFVFWTAFATYDVFKDVTSKKKWTVLIIAGVLAAYTHYFALVSVMVIYFLLLCVLIYQRQKDWFIKYLAAICLSVICYLPWMVNFIMQIKYKIDNPYWIEPITLKSLLVYAYSVNAPAKVSALSGIVSVLLGVIILSLIIVYGKSKQRGYLSESLLLATVPFGTMVLGIVVSFIIRPVFDIRYLYPSWPLFLVCLALLAANIKYRQLVNGLLVAYLCVGSVGLGNNLGYGYFKDDYVGKLLKLNYDKVVCSDNATNGIDIILYYYKQVPTYVQGVNSANPCPKMVAYDDTVKLDDKTLLLSSQDTLTTFKGHKLKLIGSVSGYVDQKEYCYLFE